MMNKEAIRWWWEEQKEGAGFRVGELLILISLAYHKFCVRDYFAIVDGFTSSAAVFRFFCPFFQPPTSHSSRGKNKTNLFLMAFLSPFRRAKRESHDDAIYIQHIYLHFIRVGKKKHSCYPYPPSTVSSNSYFQR